MAPSVVGIVGVGNMGGGMALNLLRHGWKVWVCDLDAARTAMLAAHGARVAADAAELAAHVQTLIVAVVDAEQTAQVLWGAGGFVHGLSGQPQGVRATVLLCPTIAPEDAEACALRLAEHAVDLIEAPMSGGPARARDASMSLMVACDETVFARQESLLRTLSSRLFRVGQRAGEGARTKLVNNLLAAINLVGAAEVLALARHLGLDPAATLKVIEQSSGQSWIGSDRMARALAGDLAPRAHMGLLAKDTRLAVAMASAAGFEGPLGAAACDMFGRACKAGLADVDDGALYPLLAGTLPTIPP